MVGSARTKRVLGAVIDADPDTGVPRRLQDLRRRLDSAYELPDAFPVDGLILRPSASRPDRARLPILGVWLMPDNERDGIFEDLLRVAMTVESESYISAVVDKAKVDGVATYSDVERSKVIVKTHVAWQDPDKKNVGEAIGQHFENLAPACQPFLGWLERLFGEPVA